MTIGIIGAMDVEVETLKAKMSWREDKTISGMALSRGTLAGVQAVVVRCGVGKVNAALCAQTLIREFGVDKVINTGVAGSLDDAIDIGDLVVSTDAVHHDFDVTPLGYEPGLVPGLDCTAFEADAAMRACVVDAAKAAGLGVKVFEGRVCSGDQFVGSSEQKAKIKATFGGECCEMEGAAIAHVCHVNEVPFVIVRAISDKADDDGSVTYAEFEKKAAEHCAALVFEALPHLA